MKKKRSTDKSGRKAAGGVSAVIDRVRSNSLATSDHVMPEMLDDVAWIVDRGLERRIWKLLEEDLPEESYDAIVFATKFVASRLMIAGSSVLHPGEIAEMLPMVIMPFAILLNATFLAGEAEQFPTSLPDSVGHAVESGLMHLALGMHDDITVFCDPRLYQPQHPEWLQPSATRRYLKSIAEHITDPTTHVAALTGDYKLMPEPGPLPDDLEVCQRLICGAIVTPVGEDGEALEESARLLFGDRDDESGVKEEKFQELARLIEDEFAGRCLLTESSVLINPMPIELWDVPRFVFQVQRTVSVGVAIEMALDQLQEKEPDRELKSALYISVHGSEESLNEFRFAAYLVDEDGNEEEAPFFTYAWDIAFEVESPEDIDDATGDMAAQLNASVTNVKGLQSDERCHRCDAKLFFGRGGKLYHELVGPDECQPPFEN